MNFKKYDIVSISKSNRFFYSLIIFAGLLLSGCGTDNKSSELMIINVLDKNYYQDCHITGSVNIPFEDLEHKIARMDKNKQYVLYCSNYACMAAPASATLMKNEGFKNTSVYSGGIVEWYQQKRPYQGPAKMEYLTEENEPLAEDEEPEGVTIIKAEELLEKMKKSGLLS